ncbi:hypothetical protein JL722_10062 [Aureococcus anophagefferens]|nr:hypothetical protein JL722_10062 [Aureococcus anophagefferens]
MSLLAARRVAAAAGAALYAGDRARCDVSTPPLMRPDGWTPLYLRSIERLTAVGAAGGRGAGSGANAAAAAAASVSGEYGVAKYVFASAEPSSTCAAGVASCVMVPWGVMSKHIAGLKVGDTLDFKGPMPKLPYAANEFDAVGMVAGGTGITPMLQVLEKALADPADATKFALLFGNVTPDDILLKGRLDARGAPAASRSSTVDAPPSWWRGGRGYVDKKAIARFLPAATQKTKILVCGPPGLVKMVAGEKVSFKDQGPVGGHLADLGFSRTVPF